MRNHLCCYSLRIEHEEEKIAQLFANPIADPTRSFDLLGSPVSPPQSSNVVTIACPTPQLPATEETAESRKNGHRKFALGRASGSPIHPHTVSIV